MSLITRCEECQQECQPYIRCSRTWVNGNAIWDHCRVRVQLQANFEPTYCCDCDKRKRREFVQRRINVVKPYRVTPGDHRCDRCADEYCASHKISGVYVEGCFYTVNSYGNKTEHITTPDLCMPCVIQLLRYMMLDEDMRPKTYWFKPPCP